MVNEDINILLKKYDGDIKKIANSRFNYFKFSESMRDDFIQNCFISFVKNINTFDFKYNISNYIFMICNSQAKMELRKLKGRGKIDKLEVKNNSLSLDFENTSQKIENQLSQENNFEQNLIYKSIVNELFENINIKDRDIKVFELFMNGYKYIDIARELNISKGSVQNTFNKARKVLSMKYDSKNIFC